jgi:two-component system NtrC family sensor kinase
MQRSIDRAGRIVQGLLTFGRKRPLQRQRVNLRRLLEQVLDVSAADLRLARVIVETEVVPDVADIWADDHQLQQVLLNLVTNAKQALADVVGERRLRLSIRALDGERVSIVVEDNGPGISPELIPTIFDPFVTTKGVRGTGLGLSISYGIVREHGGHIAVHSRLGSGARFTIDLPIGALEPELPPPSPAPAQAVGGALILLAEDEDSLREILRGHLEHAGYRTTSAASAEEALGRLNTDVQMVISDLHLPGVDGLAFYREVVSRVPVLKRRFLFITAGEMSETARRAADLDQGRVLQKPFTRQQLLEAVREALG